jgi:hypothetical protein
MFNKFIAALTLLVVCGSASAEETLLGTSLEVEGVRYSQEFRDPILWTPVSNRLSRHTLILPRQGIRDAIQYHDTAPLFYLSQVNDGGLSVIKDEHGTFDFYLTPNQSRFQYLHPLSEALTVSAGVKVEEDDVTPLIAGELRSITGHHGLQHGTLGLSNSSVDLFMARTELNMAETHEKIWTLSLNSKTSRIAYGWRWFDVSRDGTLLTEFGLSDADPVLGVQLERRVQDGIGYVGLLTNTASKKSEAFIGIKYDFASNTRVRMESGQALLSSSAQSLRTLRRNALPNLWRSRIKITEHQTATPQFRSMLADE